MLIKENWGFLENIFQEKYFNLNIDSKQRFENLKISIIFKLDDLEMVKTMKISKLD